jgi:endonuclease/exonuclease/phosphatase family metal-dependent hydrolase
MRGNRGPCTTDLALLPRQAAKPLGIALQTPRGMAAAGASGFAAELVRRSAAGEAFPRGAAVKGMMYDAFLGDVERGAAALNPLVPAAPSPGLRVVSWNVHFFQRGYSGEEGGDNRAEVAAVLAELQPDVILLQELVCPADWLQAGGSAADEAPGVELTEERKAALLQLLDPALGYRYVAVAPEPDCHVLPESVRCAPGSRLAVGVLSRLPLSDCAAVPLGGDSHGCAARAVVTMPSGGAAETEAELAAVGQALRVALYSVHLSVRCGPELRREEISGVLADAAEWRERCSASAAEESGGRCTVLIGGDFNQPTERDYPSDVWAAMAKVQTV